MKETIEKLMKELQDMAPSNKEELEQLRIKFLTI